MLVYEHALSASSLAWVDVVPLDNPKILRKQFIKMKQYYIKLENKSKLFQVFLKLFLLAQSIYTNQLIFLCFKTYLR